MNNGIQNVLKNVLIAFSKSAIATVVIELFDFYVRKDEFSLFVFVATLVLLTFCFYYGKIYQLKKASKGK